MNKLVTIQCHVPICPECGGGLKHKQITQEFLCFHCGNRYKVIDQGKGDRALICEQKSGR